MRPSIWTSFVHTCVNPPAQVPKQNVPVHKILHHILVQESLGCAMPLVPTYPEPRRKTTSASGGTGDSGPRHGAGKERQSTTATAPTTTTTQPCGGCPHGDASVLGLLEPAVADHIVSRGEYLSQSISVQWTTSGNPLST